MYLFVELFIDGCRVRICFLYRTSVPDIQYMSHVLVEGNMTLINCILMYACTYEEVRFEVSQSVCIRIFPGGYL